MALINCPECAKSVSDKAANCPDCGFPIYQAASSGGNIASIDPATTIEQTSKKWKKIKIIAGLLILIGIIVSSSDSPAIGAWILFAGLCSAVYAGFGSWWHHS